MTARRIGLLGCSLALALVGCRQEPGAGEGAVGGGDIVNLLRADREFAEFSSEEGYIEAYRRFSAEDVLLLPPGREPRWGRDRIYREDLAEGLVGRLEWVPEDGSVATSGDLGWSWGRWTFSVEGEEGGTETSFGKYLFLWRWSGGEWTMTANIWNDNPEP